MHRRWRYILAALTAAWFLLRPPVDRLEEGGATTVMDTAPLVIWDQVGRYPSRQACEATRDEVLEKVRRLGSAGEATQVWLATRWLHARCEREEALPR